MHVLESKPLQRLGACSYSLYLTHSPIVVTVHHALRRLGVESGMPIFLVTLAIAVPLAVVFAMWFASLFEIPFQRHRSWAAWRDVVSTRWGGRVSSSEQGPEQPDAGDTEWREPQNPVEMT